MKAILCVFGENQAHYWVCQQSLHAQGFRDITILSDTPGADRTLVRPDHLWTRFLEVYRHQSPNSREFELSCFRRWFAIHDHICAVNIFEPIMHCDNDVYWMVNPEEDLKNYGGPMTFPLVPVVYIRDPQFLYDLLLFFISYFIQPYAAFVDPICDYKIAKLFFDQHRHIPQLLKPDPTGIHIPWSEGMITTPSGQLAFPAKTVHFQGQPQLMESTWKRLNTGT